MQITFLNVSGECLLSDGFVSQEPYVGMTWNGIGPVLVATGQGGVATLEVDGGRLDLPPRSVAKLDGLARTRKLRRLAAGAAAGFVAGGPGGAVLGAAAANVTARDLKLIVGRLWATIYDDAGWDDAPNAAVGVRG